MQYSVLYECFECDKILCVSPNDDFDHEPCSRFCPLCNTKGLAYRGPKNFKSPYVRSDNIGGIQGIQSQADGKYYDSKSAYEASLKAKGMVIVGDDVSIAKPQPKTEEIDWKQAVSETLKTNKFSPTKKGKK